jgi:hypothetical protein
MKRQLLKKLVIPIVFFLGCGSSTVVVDGPATASSEPVVIPAQPTHPAPSERVELVIHIMSKCPYGNMVLQNVVPLARRLGDRFELRVEYIGSGDDGELSSMHGPDEVLGDMLQLCVRRSSSYNAWLGFLECQSGEWRQIPEGWLTCAAEQQLDAEEVGRCVGSAEGQGLLRASFRESELAGAVGSPTMFLNDDTYGGGRSEIALSRAICGAYSGSPPALCNDLPPPLEVPVTILTDTRCQRPECDIEPEIAKLRVAVPGAVLTRLDFGDPRGRDLFQATGLKMLPAIVVGSEIDQDTDSRFTSGMMRWEGNYLKQIGRFDPLNGTWTPRPEVPVRILIDSRCKTRECESLSRFEDFIERQMPGVQITTVDYTTSAGKALWRQVSSAHKTAPQAQGGAIDSNRRPLGLPLALFNKRVELEDEAYSRLSRRFLSVGDEYLFQLGSWDPTAEICDNGRDDDGDRVVDCRDSDCRGTRVCRPEQPRDLRLFMMSQCPYSNKVLQAMRDVLDNFGRNRSKVDFHLSYVGTIGENGELRSMHGLAEIEENKRQLCAQQHYPTGYAFMEYIWCRADSFRSDDWERCATGPVDASVIRRCAEGDEGTRLLRESFELSHTLDITGSPTWLLNNRYDMNGRMPQDIKDEYCQRNPLPECQNSLARPNPAGAPGGG